MQSLAQVTLGQVTRLGLEAQWDILLFPDQDVALGGAGDELALVLLGVLLRVGAVVRELEI